MAVLPELPQPAAAALEAAGAETCVVDLLTVRVACLAGFAAADLTCFTVFTVFDACVLAEVLMSVAAGVESVAVGAGVVDASAAGAVSAGTGAGAGAGATEGAGSDGTGCACCASTGVVESAKAAAIAGRALARAFLRVIFIMGNNRRV